MKILNRCSRRIVSLVAATMFFPSAMSFSQGTAPVGSASQTAGSETPSSQCVKLAETSIPRNETVEAKITGLNSAHLKQGKDIWFKVAHAISFSGCTLEPDSVVYARIVSSTVSKDPAGSELSLSFDHADCSGHDKKPVQFRLIGVVGPPDEGRHLHDATPAEVSGAAKGISAAASANPTDLELNPSDPSHTVQPGIVVGIPRVKLEPNGGPDCSDRLTSPDQKIQLAPGSEFILTVTETRTVGLLRGPDRIGNR